MTTAVPAWPASRAIGIGLVAGLHAAVLGLLLADAARHRGEATAPARAFMLVPLRAAAPATPPPSPPPPAVRRPADLRPDPRPTSRPARIPAAPPVPAAAVAEPAPITPLPAAPDPFAEATVAAPAAPASLAERARSSAGKIARELAQEAPAVLAPGALAARRDKDFDRAYRGGTNGFTLDRYVSPDGTSVTRRTSRRGVKCYMPAPFQPSAIPRSSERQQEINCPPDDGRWQRH